MCNSNRICLVFAAALLAGSAAAQDPSTTTATRPAAPARTLDLRPPDITKLYTPQQLEQMLAKLAKNIENVEVEGKRELPPLATPRVWPAIAAPLWALLHPTQAWRIFAPLPPDQTRGMQRDRPDATRTFIEPAAAVHP